MMSALDIPAKHIPQWTMADRMRKARMDAGYTAAQIAEVIGISRKTVTNYENGDTVPLRAILNAWAEVTGTYVEWLRDGSLSITHDYRAHRHLRLVAYTG